MIQQKLTKTNTKMITKTLVIFPLHLQQHWKTFHFWLLVCKS